MKTSLPVRLTPIALALGLAVAGVAHAQYAGPADDNVIQSVQAALDAKRDDLPVRLTGHVVRQINEERYVFRDDTGEIEIDIDDDLVLPRFDDKVRVEIIGEVDRNRLSANEIEVKQLRVLAQ